MSSFLQQSFLLFSTFTDQNQKGKQKNSLFADFGFLISNQKSSDQKIHRLFIHLYVTLFIHSFIHLMENNKTKTDIVMVFDMIEPHRFKKHNTSQSDVVCWDWITSVCGERQREFVLR